MSSTRVINGSLSKGSTTHDINPEGTLSGSHNISVDGHYVSSYQQISERVSIFPRSNASDLTYVGNSLESKKIFDDTRSPMNLDYSLEPRNDIGSFLGFYEQSNDFYLTEYNIVVSNLIVGPLTSRLQTSPQLLYWTDLGINPGDYIYFRPTGEKIKMLVWKVKDSWDIYDGSVNDGVSNLKSLPVVWVPELCEPPFSPTVQIAPSNDPLDNIAATVASYSSILEDYFVSIDSSSRLGVLHRLDNPIAEGAGRGRVTQRFNHHLEKLDLGQSEDYDDDEIFYDYSDLDRNPEQIIKTHPMGLHLPKVMVNNQSSVSMNGVLDPLGIRTYLDLSKIETPYPMRGVRGQLGDDDPFRRSIRIADGLNRKDLPTEPFLDAPEYFFVGKQQIDSLVIPSLELPSVFYEDATKISPFTDTSSYQELYFTDKERLGVNIGDDFKEVLLSGSGFDVDDKEEYDIYGSRGRDYIGGGTDSIVFGGLKK